MVRLLLLALVCFGRMNLVYFPSFYSQLFPISDLSTRRTTLPPAHHIQQLLKLCCSISEFRYRHSMSRGKLSQNSKPASFRLSGRRRASRKTELEFNPRSMAFGMAHHNN